MHKNSLIVAITIFVLAIGVTIVRAASQINDAKPAQGAAAESTPIRGNFAIAKSEITALQAQHPTSTDLAIARYKDTAGTLDDSLCSIGDAGELACSTNSTQPSISASQQGTGYIASFLAYPATTMGEIVFKSGRVSIRDDSANAALLVTQTNATGDAMSIATGTGSNGDYAFQFSEGGGVTQNGGVCLTKVVPSVGDPIACNIVDAVHTTADAWEIIGAFGTAANTTYVLDALIVGHKTSGSCGSTNDGAGYRLQAVYKGDDTTAVQIGTDQKTVIGESQGGWDVRTQGVGNIVDIQVYGANDCEISWHMTYTMMGVSS